MKKNLFLVFALLVAVAPSFGAVPAQEKIRDLERSIVQLKEEMLLAREDSYDMGDDSVELDLGGDDGGFHAYNRNFFAWSSVLFAATVREGGNRIFNTSFAWRGLWRFHEEWLNHWYWIMDINNGSVRIRMNEAWAAYFPSDCLAFVVGYMRIPFGIYSPQNSSAVVRKTHGAPLARAGNAIVPETMVGAHMQYTYDFCCDGSSWLKHGWFSWDSFITPGLEQVAAGTGPAIGALLNNEDNNQDQGFGGRLGLWADPGKTVGLSYYRCRWNSNPRGPAPSIAPHRYYWAAAADLCWHFWDHYLLYGEYLYANHATDVGNHVETHGYHLVFSAWLTVLTEHMCMTQCMVDMLSKMEVAVMGSSIWPGVPDQDRHQYSFSATYWIEPYQKLIAGYEIRTGDRPQDNNNLFNISFNSAI